MSYVAARQYFQPLGSDEDDFRARVRQLDEEGGKIQRSWPSSRQTYPIEFVYAVMKVVSSHVVRPFTDTKIRLLKSISNVFVAGELADTGQHMQRNYETLVAETFAAVDAAEAAKAKTVTLPRFRDQVIATINGAYAGWYRLAYLAEIKPWYLELGPVTDAVLRGLAWIRKAIEAVGKFIPALPDVGGAIGTAIKWTLYGTAGYLAYKLLVPKRSSA